MADLPSNLRDALNECRRHTDKKRVYWWRRASMNKLVALGLVEPWFPNGKVTKLPAFRPTVSEPPFPTLVEDDEG